MRCTWIYGLLMVCTASASAQAPNDNRPDKVRPVPPPGVEIKAEDREALSAGVAQLDQAIEGLQSKLAGQSKLLALLPDVVIYRNAVYYALNYNEFHNLREVPIARDLLKQGMERANALGNGKAPWTTATGLVVRGYRSRLDGSVQPFGLVIPADYQFDGSKRHRLDLWLHGRGETLSEINFIYGRSKAPGEFTPAGAIVLHSYGRYCNATKFAGEMDVLESMEHAKSHYRIDDRRIAVRGFSMGGASTWHLAVHYPSLWAVAAPGAGFAETPVYLNVVKNETVEPTWYHKRLWHLYDATDYAVNLFNCPTIAYSGELDKQKQAADIMAAAMKAEGLQLEHIIGPKTEHKYEPQAKLEVAQGVDSIVEKGRDLAPRQVKFTTFTLKYNQSHWVTIDGLNEHWERARIDAAIVGTTQIKASTKNVSALTFAFGPGDCPLDSAQRPAVEIDGQQITPPSPQADRSWKVHFRRAASDWQLVEESQTTSLAKVHGLQGPIDDAFMDSFLMVAPTGNSKNDAVAAWVKSEQHHAVEHWRKQFRAELQVKNDREVTDAEIASSNLVLWGDPGSNQVLAKIAHKLPIRWTASSITVGDKTYPSESHVPVLIYPNPLNPQKYVVLNSGFTFREYDYLTNARQTPKLPDWAIVDVRVPPSTRFPGDVIDANFFDERWQLKK